MLTEYQKQTPQLNIAQLNESPSGESSNESEEEEEEEEAEICKENIDTPEAKIKTKRRKRSNKIYANLTCFYLFFINVFNYI